MLTQDTTAFVEQIDVPKPDRKADKLRRRSANEELEIVHTTVELRLAEEALKRLAEQELAEETSGGDPHGHGLFRRNGRAHARTEDARRMVGHVRERLAAQRARAKELEQQIQDFEAVRPHHTSYRLHSSQHHETYSANQFERMAKVAADPAGSRHEPRPPLLVVVPRSLLVGRRAARCIRDSRRRHRT